MGNNTHLGSDSHVLEDALPKEKPEPVMKQFKSARDEFTVPKAITMLIGLALGGFVGGALGSNYNLAGALVGALLGGAAGLTVGISIWY